MPLWIYTKKFSGWWAKATNPLAQLRQVYYSKSVRDLVWKTWNTLTHGMKASSGWHGDFDSLDFSETFDTALTSEEQPSLASLLEDRGLPLVKRYVIPTPRTHPNPRHCLVNLNSSSIIA